MSLRFFQRVRIAPGITLNLSKSGGSISLGPRGAKLTLGSSGVRATAGLPGTGLFYTKKLDTQSASKRQASAAQAVSVSPEDRLNLSFFKRLVTPQPEEHWVDACRAMVQGKEKEATKLLSACTDRHADSEYLLGFLALKTNDLPLAEQALKAALKKHQSLGKLFDQYELSSHITIAITEHITAYLTANQRSCRLGLVEVYQELGQFDKALKQLEQLRAAYPNDSVILLSMIELLCEDKTLTKANAKKVIALSKDSVNESEAEAAILYYKAKALMQLGLTTAAKDTLTIAFRRKKDRDKDLLLAIQFERACVYEMLGESKRARSEFEKIYLASPNYPSVAERLNL